uniref:Uncharacterized protein n=1 Tax=Hordeum vulgare subsp. vulgare TaxID=112509 RepID=A0A8I6XY45_HORVV
MARQAMKGWGANLGADRRARKGALLARLRPWMTWRTGLACPRMTGPGDTPSMPSSWTYSGVRNCSGNVEEARTGFSRGMQTPCIFRPSLTAVGGSVSSLSSGMGMLYWKTQKTSHPIFIPSIRIYSRLCREEAPPFVRTSGR